MDDLPQKEVAVEHRCSCRVLLRSEESIDIGDLDPHVAEIDGLVSCHRVPTDRSVQAAGTGAGQDVDLGPAEDGRLEKRSRERIGALEAIEFAHRPTDPYREAHASPHREREPQDSPLRGSRRCRAGSGHVEMVGVAASLFTLVIRRPLRPHAASRPSWVLS